MQTKQKNNVELVDEFVVVAFGGPTLKQTNLSRFKEITDANIDVLVPANQSVDGPSNLKALDLAEKVGIRVLTWDKRVCPMAVTTNAPINYKAVKGMTKEYKNHAAFAGYVLRDEPGSEMFYRLKKLRELFLKRDSKHEPLINLFPSYADKKQLGANSYQEYLNEYVKIVTPSIISYDNYPLLATDTFSNIDIEKREEIFYNDLKTFSALSYKTKIPFWNFISCAGIKAGTNNYLRVPNRAEILWQGNISLAFGSHGICWFCYWTPKIATIPGALEMNEEYYNGAINSDGKKTAVYNFLKEENTFLKKNGQKLVDWKHVYTARYKNGKKINGKSPFAEPVGKNFDLVIGTFVKGDEQCLVIANASYKKSAQFSLFLAKEFQNVKIIDTIDAKFNKEKNVWKLNPGGCSVIFLTRIDHEYMVN